MEFPAYPKRHISEVSSGFVFQETGQPDRRPEIVIHLIGADETVFDEILQTMEKNRRLREKQNGGSIEYCMEYSEYYGKEETKTLIHPD